MTMPHHRTAERNDTATPQRTALYLRVSTARQAKREIPIAGQELECREFAAGHGWEVVAVYRDEGVSGHTDQRPDLQEMLRAAERREFDALVLWEISRLSRRAEHTLSWVAKL